MLVYVVAVLLLVTPVVIPVTENTSNLTTSFKSLNASSVNGDVL